MQQHNKEHTPSLAKTRSAIVLPAQEKKYSRNLHCAHARSAPHDGVLEVAGAGLHTLALRRNLELCQFLVPLQYVG